MSVDKFGRVAGSAGTKGPGKRGPPGEGFILTGEGDYNMQTKRLRNTSEGVAPEDVITLKQLNSKLPIRTAGVNAYTFKDNRITEVGMPVEKDDVVTLNYLSSRYVTKNNAMQKSGRSFNAQNIRVSNVASPLEDGDAATKSFVQAYALTSASDKNGKGIVDFKDKRLTNVGLALDGGDAVSKEYLESRCPIRETESQDGSLTIEYGGENSEATIIRRWGWLFHNLPLKECGSPADEGDAVNLKTMIKLFFNMFLYVNLHIQDRHRPNINDEWTLFYRLNSDMMVKFYEYASKEPSVSTTELFFLEWYKNIYIKSLLKSLKY